MEHMKGIKDDDRKKLEEIAQQKILIDYDNVPGVINYELIKKALLQYLPEGAFSKKIAEKGCLEETLKLKLEYYNILRIDFLWILPKLKVLSLANNLIEKIEKLESLVNLTELDLSFNKIIKIENIHTLVKLEVLNLYGNKITKIENIDKLQNLRIFSIGENRISNLDDIVYLRPFKKLKSICIIDTPFEKEYENSGETVVSILDQLMFYNYELIRDEQRVLGRQKHLQLIKELEHKEHQEREKKKNEERKRKVADHRQRALIQGFYGDEFFEKLMETDEDGNNLKSIGEETEVVFENFQKNLGELCKRIRLVGEQFLVKREVEVQNYEDSMKANEKLYGDTLEEILYELRMYRREWQKELNELLYCNPATGMKFLEVGVKRSQEIQLLYGDLVRQSWFKLMDLEMRRFDQAEEMNAKYEFALKEFVDREMEIFQGMFSDIRDCQRDFNDAITDVMFKVVAERHDDEEFLNRLAPEVKMLFGQPAMMSNAILSSHDLHLLLIDNKEDETTQLLQGWFASKVAHLPKKEVERNRKAIYKLNRFLDHELTYFDKMAKPYLLKCQELLEEDYEDKIDQQLCHDI